VRRLVRHTRLTTTALTLTVTGLAADSVLADGVSPRSGLWTGLLSLSQRLVEFWPIPNIRVHVLRNTLCSRRAMKANAIGDQLFRGNGSTQVIDATGTSTSSLSDGMAVAVDALQRADYAYAKRITEQASTPATGPDAGPDPGSDAGPDPGSDTGQDPGTADVDLAGPLGTISGVCPLVTFPVNGQVVIASTSTTYVGGSCASLTAGQNAQITGTPVGSFLIARLVTIH